MSTTRRRSSSRSRSRARSASGSCRAARRCAIRAATSRSSRSQSPARRRGERNRCGTDLACNRAGYSDERGVMRTITIVVLLAACSKGGPKRYAARWKAERTPTISFGDYVGAIPVEWRNVDDLVDPAELEGMAKPPGQSIMVPETWGRERDQPNIVASSSAAEGFAPGPGCEAFAQAVAKTNGMKTHDVVAAEFQGNSGCRWSIDAEMSGRVIVWVRGTKLHFVQCLWFPGHEKTDNEVCERFLAGVKVR